MNAKPHSRLFLYWSYFPSTECIILIHISDGIFMPCPLNDFIFPAQSHERILKDLFNLLIWKSVWTLEKPSYFISLTSCYFFFTKYSYMCSTSANEDTIEKYKCATQYAGLLFPWLQQDVLPTNSHLHGIVVFPLVWLIKVLKVWTCWQPSRFFFKKLLPYLFSEKGNDQRAKLKN